MPALMPLTLASRLRGRGPAGQPLKDQVLEGRQFRTRAMGTGRSRRRSSTPSPSFVIVSRRTTSVS